MRTSRLDGVAYLTTSDYGHWLAGIETIGRELGYLTVEEIQSGRVSDAKPVPHPPLSAEMAEELVRNGAPVTRDDGRQAAVFEVGDRVRALNLECAGHTRLARHVRGKTGTVVRLYGTHVFPDTSAHDRGENPQPIGSASICREIPWPASWSRSASSSSR